MSKTVKLTDTRKTTQVKLTDYPDALVTVYTTQVIGDQRAAMNITDDF